MHIHIHINVWYDKIVTHITHIVSYIKKTNHIIYHFKWMCAFLNHIANLRDHAGVALYVFEFILFIVEKKSKLAKLTGVPSLLELDCLKF